MIGQDILDLIESQIVMEELAGNYSRHNTHKSFDMIISNHVVSSAFHFIRDLIIECLFYTDNSGGQVKLTNLHEQAMAFLKSFVDMLDIRVYEGKSYYTLYIDEEIDERRVLGLLKNVYGFKSSYAVS
jgi:hypothetical protein